MSPPGTDTTIATLRAGDLEVAYAAPDGPGPFAAVVVLHEFWGMNDDIRSIVARFRDAGYVAAAPDLYSWGRPQKICMMRTATDVFRNGERTSTRVETVRAWLAHRPEVDAGRIGVIGFCMGAGLAMVCATRSPFAAASVNYGDMIRDTSALERACPILGTFGERDKRLRAVPVRLEEALTVFGIEHDIVVFPEAGHSFMNRGGPALFDRGQYAYVPDAAEAAWQRIFGWFGDHLSA